MRPGRTAVLFLGTVVLLAATDGLAAPNTPAAPTGSATIEQTRLQGGLRRDLTVSAQVEAIIRDKERLVAAKRRDAIALLETFLAEHVHAPEEAEVLYQLAELLWEESKADFLVQMAAYQASVEECASRISPGGKPKLQRPVKRGQPAARLPTVEKCGEKEPPAFHLERSQVIYRRLIDEHGSFAKIDAVRYLYGFSLRDQGHLDEALVQFRRIIADHPSSRFLPDAWMAVAEARFYEDGDYKGALDAYYKVLAFTDSPLYDIALFKTAWCLWKQGDPEGAAKRFKEVLDLGGSGAEKKYHTSKEGQKRLKELQSEALDYLVQIFTEDERKGAKEAYDFLSSIGGVQYSRKVLDKLGEIFQTQARYSRAIETERFLISLDAEHLDNPKHQTRLIESYRAMDDGNAAVKELRELVEKFGPGTTWATKNAKEHPKEVEEARVSAAGLGRDLAKELHSAAQGHEKMQKGRPDLDRYARAADAYAYYLAHFGTESDAVEIRYLLGDIYYFKLKKYEDAGDAYLGVGQANPAGKYHREALLNAMNAYKKVRVAVLARTPTLKQLLPSDRKLGTAMDRFVELYPKDSKEIVNILYENGELFYTYGDYDEAVKRFGLIVEKYPREPIAATAGDKILESLNKAKDYANIEAWARRLLKVPAFQSAANQDRLGKLVIDAGFKSGEQKAEKDPLGAADTFVRVAKEFPKSSRAPTALTNAAQLYVAAGKPEEAVVTYGKLVDNFPASKEAASAAWAAGKLYEQAALWEQAAKFYELLAEKYPSDTHAADALFNAGLLREHLGEPQVAIARYGEYAKRYRGTGDAGDAAFRVGVVLDGSGKKEEAARAFSDYASRNKGARAVEALARAGAALIDAGADRRAADPLQKALHLHRSLQAKGTGRHAARARYLQGEIVFKEYERIVFDRDPRKLRGALEKKSKKLEEARSVYLDVVSFGDPEWATAALYRIGDAYERFAKAMRGTPVPTELKEEEQQVYRQELEKVVVVIEEKAIDAYKNGYQKALQLGVYNDFTQKLRQALGRLNDQEFPPEIEARSGHAPSSLQSQPPLMDEVKR